MMDTSILGMAQRINMTSLAAYELPPELAELGGRRGSDLFTLIDSGHRMLRVHAT